MRTTLWMLAALACAGCWSDDPGPEPAAAWLPALRAALGNGASLPAGATHAELEAALWKLVAEDSALVTAALRRLPEVWDGGPGASEPALLAVLESPRAEVQAAAIATAGAAIASDSSATATRAALLGLARAHPALGARFAAQEALAALPPAPDTGRLLVDALGDSATVLVASALLRLSGRVHALAERDAVRAACARLSDHTDPGVRGAALALRSQLVTGAESRAALGRDLDASLSDPHPYVRSQAALAVGRLRRKASLEKLMELVRDSADNAYRLDGFTLLDGSPGALEFPGSTWRRVDDAALEALSYLSLALAEPFSYGDVRADQVERDIARQVMLAELWYEDVSDPDGW